MRDFERKLPKCAATIAKGTESAAYVSVLPHLFADTPFVRRDLDGVVDSRTTLDPNSAHGFFYASTQIELPPHTKDVIADTELLRKLASLPLWTVPQVLANPTHPQFSNVQNHITRVGYGIELVSLILALKNGDSYEVEDKDLFTGVVTGLSATDTTE